MLNKRAKAHQGLGSFRNAIQDLNWISENVETEEELVKVIKTRALCHEKCGNTEAAIDDWREVRDLNFDDERVARSNIRRLKRLRKSAGENNHFETLGVSKEATCKDIKQAYRKLALKWHPDKNCGSVEEFKKAEEKFKMIQEAYEVLKNPETRERHAMDDMSGSEDSYASEEDFSFYYEEELVDLMFMMNMFGRRGNF